MVASTLEVTDFRLAIIGLGYVGLPLAIEFGKQRSVVGFDINQARVDELKSGQDHTLEVSPEELKAAQHLSFTTRPDDLRVCNCFIVTVPTPIDEHKQPDLIRSGCLCSSIGVGTVTIKQLHTRKSSGRVVKLKC